MSVSVCSSCLSAIFAVKTENKLNPSYTYLAVNACCIVVPLACSFHPRIRLYRHWHRIFPSLLITAAVFIAWDILFTMLRIWSFNERRITGITVLSLPLEELLFFICIPYACTFTYFCFTKFRNPQPVFTRAAAVTGLLLASALIICASLFLTRLYTSVTFFACAAMLVVMVLTSWRGLGLFLFTYLVLLIPMLLSDGVLTGSFTGDAVVLYDAAHIIGLRIGTVPLEDAFYGMLLVGLNIWPAGLCGRN